MSEIRDRVVGLVRVRARDLVPHPKNPRVHPESQLAALRGIFREVGFASAVIGRRLPDGRVQVLDGHARVGLLPDEELPVLLLDVTEEEGEKLLATFDPVAAMAQQDDAKLRELIAGLKTEEDALQAVWDELVNRPPLPGLTDPDEVPEPPEEPTVKRGELVSLGKHRLLCGDAGSAEDVDRLLDGAPAHLLSVDPGRGTARRPPGGTGGAHG